MIALAGAARAEEPKRLALMPLDARDAQLDASTEHILGESIRSATASAVSAAGYSVIGGVAASDPVQAARDLKAQLYVTGTVGKSEGVYVAFVRLFDSATGRQLGAVEIDKATIREVRQEFDAKAPALFASIAVPAAAVAVPATPVAPAVAVAATPQPVAPVAVASPPPVVLEPRFATPAGFARTLHFQLGAKFDRPYTIQVTLAGQRLRCPLPLSPTAGCDLRPVIEGDASYDVLDGAAIVQHGVFQVHPMGSGLKLLNTGHPRWATLVGNWAGFIGLGVLGVGVILWGVGGSSSEPGTSGATASTVGEVMVPVGLVVAGTAMLIRWLVRAPSLEPMVPDDAVIAAP